MDLIPGYYVYSVSFYVLRSIVYYAQLVYENQRLSNKITLLAEVTLMLQIVPKERHSNTYCPAQNAESQSYIYLIWSTNQ